MARDVSTGRTRSETLGTLGLWSISAGAAMNPEDRINAGRLMIPMTWFDAEKCAGGLERLRGYRKRWLKATRSYGGPLHDEMSHGADAFGEFAANRGGGAAVKRPGVRRIGGAGLGWMG
jgi:phage terminase large subunit